MSGLDAWGARVLGPMPGGARSTLLKVEIAGVPHVARKTLVAEPSLRWLARLQAVAQRQGIRLAPLIPAQGGALQVGGWTVEPWLDGTPGLSADLCAVRQALRRLHRATRGWPLRPGQAGSGAHAVHGDVHAANLLRLRDGGIALVDWEEACLGDPRLDLGFPDTAAGRAAHVAAERRACWQAEPQRAKAMARRLRMFGLVARQKR